MKPTPLPWALAVALGFWAAGAAPAQDHASATIVVTVPDDATLIFDDHATRQTARTATDEQARQVALTDVRVTAVEFPTAPDRAREFADALQRDLAQNWKAVSLDSLRANLAVTRAAGQGQPAQVKNEPPRVIV